MFIKVFLVALIIFFAVDMFWLGFIAKSFYTKQIGFLMKENINWTAAIIFYILFIAALVLFVIQPAIDKKSLQHAILMGAAFGFITYATYDLTNLATLKDWPLLVTIVDLCWGAFIAASVSALTYFISIKVFV